MDKIFTFEFDTEADARVAVDAVCNRFEFERKGEKTDEEKAAFFKEATLKYWQTECIQGTIKKTRDDLEAGIFNIFTKVKI